MKWVERAVSIVLYPISIPPPFLLILKSRVVLIAFLRKAHITSSCLNPLVYFSTWCTLYHKKGEILGYFGYFVANLCTFWCTFTGLNNAVVYQN